ncbi:MAG: alpha/beta hydrolase [Rhizomicrobium sp.]
MRALTLLAAATALLVSGSAHAIALKPCQPKDVKGDALCGTYVVPENYALKDGRQLPLKVVVLSANKKPAKEPIFFLSGGPGQAATEDMGWVTDAWRNEHDFVFVDMRGTGEGTRLDCAIGKSAAHPEEFMEPLFHEGTQYGECAKALSKKADLTQYTTTNAMRDLDGLRKTLGYKKINLWGGSYGTRAGIVYLHLYPQNVRSAILSGLVPPSNRNPLYFAAAAERSFETLAAQCAADAACHKAFPDPKGDADAIVAQLRAKPVPVTVKNPATGQSVTVPMTASAFGDGLRLMLYDAEESRRIPLLLKGARAGDFTPFANVALGSSMAMKQGVAMGLLLSVICTEDISRIRPEEVGPATAGSIIGDYRVRGEMAACSVWPKGELPKDYAAPFKTGVPVLLISGNLDPVTPPQWGVEAQKFFPNSRHVIAPGGHVSDNKCLERVERDFIATANPKTLDASCITNEKLPPFALPAKP